MVHPISISTAHVYGGKECKMQWIFTRLLYKGPRHNLYVMTSQSMVQYVQYGAVSVSALALQKAQTSQFTRRNSTHVSMIERSVHSQGDAESTQPPPSVVHSSTVFNRSGFTVLLM